MQCGRVGSRPLSTTEGSQGHAPWEPSLHLEAQETHPQPRDPPPAPPSEGRGVECQGRRQARRPRACTFSWSCTLPTNVGSSFASDSGDRAWCPIAGAVPASDCRGCACVRLQGRTLRPIAGAVPCAAPKEMFDRFSNDPNIWRMPIMHYPFKEGFSEGWNS